jgi:hypothetical protein
LRSANTCGFNMLGSAKLIMPSGFRSSQILGSASFNSR